MTLRDDNKLCHECKRAGWLRKAHRIMPSGGHVCDEHYRHLSGKPQLNREAEAFIENWKRKIAA
jgi:hypothetical protein